MAAIPLPNPYDKMPLPRLRPAGQNKQFAGY